MIVFAFLFIAYMCFKLFGIVGGILSLIFICYSIDNARGL